MLKQAIEEVPEMCKSIWKYDFKLPMTCEISVGMNLADMETLDI